MGRFGKENIESYLRQEFDGKPVLSEGLSVQKIEGSIVIFENIESEDKEKQQLAFDGLHGIARTDSGELLYVPTLKIVEGKDRFIGLTVLHEEDNVPYKKSEEQESLTAKGFIKAYACRKNYFTDEAWQEYKNEINKQKVIRVGAGVVTVTALGLTAGTIWRQKHRS